MSRSRLDRRHFLAYGGILGVGLTRFSGLALGAVCQTTPSQTEGPFYPVTFPSDSDADLTIVRGRAVAAKGSLVVVSGVVKDTACNPIKGAIVEIWQACANGRYNDDRDTNPLPRDPDFQGWGRVATNERGEYRFTTIKPGAYPTDPNDPNGWIRPPHIHFKVRATAAPTLITQMYFAGEPLNDRDEILNDLRRQVGDDAANVVIVSFTGTGTSAVDPLVGRFDLTVGARLDPRVTPFLD